MGVVMYTEVVAQCDILARVVGLTSTVASSINSVRPMMVASYYSQRPPLLTTPRTIDMRKFSKSRFRTQIQLEVPLVLKTAYSNFRTTPCIGRSSKKASVPKTNQFDQSILMTAR